ncbi:MAG: hypothetical protein KAS65_07245 [Candidatus Aminicenantes bacterium]|nr:hypothetical protein [Candidatus Aminicenantes bacterium]
MKKLFGLLTTLVMIFGLLGFSGCGKSTTADLSGVKDLLAFIPENATGVFTINLKKITRMDVFKEQLEKSQTEPGMKEKEFFHNYQEFIEKTGVDPEKDIDTMVIAMFKSFNMKMDSNKGVAGIISLNYDKDKVLNFIKEKTGEYTVESHGDQTIYNFTSSKNNTVSLSFLNNKFITFGENAYVKGIIDLKQKGGKSLLDNVKLKPYINEIQSGKVIHFVFGFPKELKESQPQGTPFKVDLSKAETLVGFIDHENQAWSGEIKLISPDEESNKQIVNLLNGLKGMAALAGPEVSELVSNINLTSSVEDIKLTFSLTDELLKKLQAKAKEKASGFMQQSEFE